MGDRNRPWMGEFKGGGVNVTTHRVSAIREFSSVLAESAVCEGWFRSPRL